MMATTFSPAEVPLIILFVGAMILAIIFSVISAERKSRAERSRLIR